MSEDRAHKEGESAVSSRRTFITDTLQIGAGALLAGAAVGQAAVAEQTPSSMFQTRSDKSMSVGLHALIDFPPLTTRVFVDTRQRHGGGESGWRAICHRSRLWSNSRMCRRVRPAQNWAFFACDPDCAAHTEKTPWELDRQFLDLVARSWSALFLSAEPRQVNPEQKAAFRTAMQLALSGGAPGGCEPLDWLDNTTPELWLMGNERVTYHWAEPMGMRPFHL